MTSRPTRCGCKARWPERWPCQERADRAIETLRTLESLAATRYVSPFEFVTISFAVGDFEGGLRWLAKACDDRCFDLLSLKYDPRFESLRGDPRIAAVVQRVGLGYTVLVAAS